MASTLGPDPNATWRIDYERHESQRASLSSAEFILRNALAEVRAIVDADFSSYQRILNYEHIKSFDEVEQPQPFRQWIRSLDTFPDIRLMCQMWQIDEIYSAAAPLEKTLKLLAKAYTSLLQELRRSSIKWLNNWSVVEHHLAIEQSLKLHDDFVAAFTRDHLEPLSCLSQEISDDLIPERGKVEPQTLSNFDTADFDGKDAILLSLWARVKPGTPQPGQWKDWLIGETDQLRILSRSDRTFKLPMIHHDVRLIQDSMRGKFTGTVVREQA